MQAVAGSRNGGAGSLVMPRLTRLIALTPTTCSQALTHKPHTIQSLSSRYSGLKDGCSIPICEANSFITLFLEHRARSRSNIILRLLITLGESVLTFNPSSTG